MCQLVLIRTMDIMLEETKSPGARRNMLDVYTKRSSKRKGIDNKLDRGREPDVIEGLEYHVWVWVS